MTKGTDEAVFARWPAHGRWARVRRVVRPNPAACKRVGAGLGRIGGDVPDDDHMGLRRRDADGAQRRRECVGAAEAVEPVLVAEAAPVPGPARLGALAHASDPLGAAERAQGEVEPALQQGRIVGDVAGMAAGIVLEGGEQILAAERDLGLFEAAREHGLIGVDAFLGVNRRGILTPFRG